MRLQLSGCRLQAKGLPLQNRQNWSDVVHTCGFRDQAYFILGCREGLPFCDDEQAGDLFAFRLVEGLRNWRLPFPEAKVIRGRAISTT